MDAPSEQKLAHINPRLAGLIRHLHDLLQKEGIEIRVTQGLRSWAEQQSLYAQGRTSPGKIVTAAQGGYSWHNFGCAVDVVPMVNGEPDWLDGNLWNRIISLAQTLGLVSGKSWNDQPHLQLTGFFPATPTDKVRSLYLQQGMTAVWDDAGLFETESKNV